MNDTTRIKDLVKIITKADDDYYNKDQQNISDQVYDAYKDELQVLVDKCKNKKLVSKVKQALASVGAMVGVSEWKKVTHDIPMNSLNKVNTPEELKDWVIECGSPKELVVVEKLDGISISLKYEDSILIQAVTRGNGEIGEEITPNVKRMKGLPKKLKKKFSGHIRGEIVMLNSDHKTHFPDKANPRNAASGVSKRHNGEGTEHLTVISYQVASGKDCKTENEQFQFLESLGVKVPYYKFCTVDKAISEWDRYQKSARDKLDYEIDGLVVRVNDMTAQLSLGEKSHRPKGATAFKFDAPGAASIVNAIVPQTGPTGKITPVAEFNPVQLVGATVKRASLYNYGYVKKLKLDIGAEVLVIRANDVVPRIESIIKGTGTVHQPPKTCPSCNSKTKMSGEYLLCTNKEDCPAQTLGRLKIWINENNILDWGDKILQRLLNEELVSDVGDLYRLTEEQLADLDRMGEKSAKNLVEILKKHKSIPLENFIGGLGIDGVATTTTKSIINAGFDTLDAIMKMSESQLENIEGFGEIRAQAFYNGLRENKDRIDDMLASGITIKARAKGSLVGKSLCFTGSMSMPRPQLHKMVEENGGDVKKSVSRGLTHLVVSNKDTTSNKMQAAQKMGINVLSEKEFLDMF